MGPMGPLCGGNPSLLCGVNACERPFGVSVAPRGATFYFIRLTQGGAALQAACPGLCSDGPTRAFASLRLSKRLPTGNVHCPLSTNVHRPLSTVH